MQTHIYIGKYINFLNFRSYQILDIIHGISITNGIAPLKMLQSTIPFKTACTANYRLFAKNFVHFLL
jgi:hypothetical protein